MSDARDKFPGFAPGSAAMVQLPESFFSELLPLVDNTAELKVLLFCFWALPQKEGHFRYLRRDDFAGSKSLMRGLAAVDTSGEPGAILDAALNSAINRGALVSAELTINAQRETLYFVNTERGRTAVAQIKAGAFRPVDEDRAVEILPPRPTIYRLYEDNIGPLTPMISDNLKDMAQEFPAYWIEEAVGISVQANKRSLRYIRAILDRWRTEGRSELEPDAQNTEEESRYVSGKYSDFIDH